jgi:hypothetical protein
LRRIIAASSVASGVTGAAWVPPLLSPPVAADAANTESRIGMAFLTPGI